MLYSDAVFSGPEHTQLFPRWPNAFEDHTPSLEALLRCRGCRHQSAQIGQSFGGSDQASFELPHRSIWPIQPLIGVSGKIRQVFQTPLTCCLTRRWFNAGGSKHVDDVDLIHLEITWGAWLDEYWLRTPLYHDVSGKLIFANPGLSRVQLRKEYDLFIAVCAALWDLPYINAIERWRDHCKIGVCWLDELWVSDIPNHKYWLPALRQFDYVKERAGMGFRDKIGTFQDSGAFPARTPSARICFSHDIPYVVHELTYLPRRANTIDDRAFPHRVKSPSAQRIRGEAVPLAASAGAVKPLAAACVDVKSGKPPPSAPGFMRC
jgi:hypothetical protein